MKKLTLFLLLWFLFQANSDAKPLDQKQTIVTLSGAAERIQYGVSRLVQSLKTKGYPIQQKVISLQSANFITANGVLVASVDQVSSGKLVPKTIIDKAKKAGKEGFVIETVNSRTYIIGADASGTLYGCLELIERLETTKAFPKQLAVTDHPQMVLRGTCIGLQKPDYLPGRDVYEYPYTPETFPWFYDKDLWIKYLDMMVDNRYNSLYLWNGHPFSSLIKLKDYPYAVEVDDATFKKNEEIFRFLTHEADKRGIWVIQMFYNIIIPKPFAEKHQLKTQDRNRPIIPLIADYTQKSIAAFVQKYPNVGLMVALGEAMEGVGQDDIDWFTKTIIPGVKDGLKAAGIQTEPPIVLRAHDTDAPAVMKAALPLYKNLYTENKFNGEALTTYEPRGAWAALNRKLAEIGSINISNVHILANLEPFRYGSADFIQKSVQAMDQIYGARGLHLYPQSSYWDWPYTADRTKDGKRILQIDRDWLWYSAWARYAWNANRNRETEKAFWAKKLESQFGTNEKSGSQLLNAYEEAGEISPKLLRRYGITDGNRQTLTLGMLMTQLINPFRYGLFTLLYESEAPEGEMIIDYAEKEWKGQQHIGETPVQIAKEVVAHGKAAVASINQVDGITKRTEEFARIKNDIYCHDAMANFYASKVQSALWVLRFKYSNQVADLEKALPLLQRSVAYYATLTKLTNDSYLYANSMQTKQRKIPMRGVDQTFIHWKEMLPVFQKELNKLQHSIDSLKNISSNQEKPVQTFANADVQIDGAFKTVKLDKGAMLWNDTLAAVKEITPQLVGLNAMQLSKSSQLKQGTRLSFTNKKPIKVLVAYFSQKGNGYLPAPTLEIDASANNYGQSEIKISNALVLEGMPPMNVHTFTFAAGKNTLTLAKGAAMILGFVDDTMPFRIFNAGLDGRGRDIDWLFE